MVQWVVIIILSILVISHELTLTKHGKRLLELERFAELRYLAALRKMADIRKKQSERKEG